MHHVVKNYSSHKEELVIDFNHKCGYCDCIDKFKRSYYEIDHFMPKEFLKEYYPIETEYKLKEQEYSNLVYACKSCNNAKRDKWPSRSIEYSHKDNEGFIDPCDSEYDDQFSRNERGEIIPKTVLGKWMYIELKLNKPEHSIIWYLEEIDKAIKEIRRESVNNESIHKDEISKLAIDFYDYYDKLTEY
jgi:hypothetical protein